VGLTTARDRFAAPAGESREEQKDPPKRIDVVPGAFVELEVDAHRMLGAGVDGPIVALFRSNVVFNPTTQGARVANISRARPLVAGFAFDEAREHLAGAPFMWHEPAGRGHVIAFADDPTFRTFLHAAHRLCLNSILLGPAPNEL
jgi:hypothetical protein